LKIIAISGSLRAGSSNGALLRAAAALAPAGMELVFYEDLGSLPHFNPDLDTDSPPENAHGIPGSLKNALDWIVSSGELNGKPVVSIMAAPSGGRQAQASLIETLSVMDMKVLVDASLLVVSAGKKVDAEGRVSDPALAQALKASLASLASAISARDSSDAQA
jgi:NAD(P)H-dependent FMN reductase